MASDQSRLPKTDEQSGAGTSGTSDTGSSY
jgi:hypothetical protein